MVVSIRKVRSSQPSRALWLSLIMAVSLSAFVFLLILTQDLFVWTEARGMILYFWPGDLGRWLLFPELNYGAGRLTGIASFQLTGRVCGLDSGCVNAVGAVMTAAAVALLMLHTRQIARSALIAVGVAAFWVLSPPVLGISIWQSARFDMLAFISAMLVGGLWWHVFGRANLSVVRMVLIVIASILLLAFAFNSKELMYYLVGILVILAIARGAPIRAIGRNLAVAAVPLLYSAFFIAFAMTHITPAYAEQGTSGDMLAKGTQVILQSFGLHRNFMFLWQSGALFDVLYAGAWIGFGLFALLLLGAMVMAIVRGGLDPLLAGVRTRAWRDPLGRAAPLLYLLATVAAVVLVSSRSRGAAVYYMPISWWAFLVVAMLLVRWSASYFSRPRAVAAGLVLAFAVPALLAYSSNFAEHTTYRRLSEASAEMADNSAILRGALGSRDVSSVAWRMLDLDDTSFFVTRGDATTYQPATEIWPWLMQDPSAGPAVTALLEGSLDELRDSVSDYSAPGEVLLVMSPDYRLQLLAHEGQVLWDPAAGQASEAEVDAEA